MANKSFDEMSSEEQKDWWLEQARYALHVCYLEIQDAEIEWLAYTHNAVFLVRHENERYILKLYLPDDDSLQVSESIVMQILAGAGLSVPIHIGNDIGFQTESFSGMLLSHLDGTSREPDAVQLNEISKIGVFLANLHKIETNEVENRPRLDFNGLFSRDGIYYPGDENMRVFTTEQLSVMDAVAEKVKQAMDELGQGEDEFGLIHGDLLLKNILFHEGEVRALDFEYCGWGYYLYDLTPLLWQLKPQERYPQLEQALWDGYTGIRPLTTRHRELLETFIAGRQVASMRWTAANQQNPHVVGKVEAILTQRTAELQAFLETGILNRR